MIKLVVFDWNGTILADARATLQGTNAELAALGKPPITLEQYRQTYEIPLTAFYKKFGITHKEMMDKSKKVAKAFHETYEPLAARARTRYGARELFATVYEKNILQVILSNHTVEGIYFQLERLKIREYFDAVLANDQLNEAHFTGKTERLKEYLDESHVKPSEVAIVGDTTEEIIIGKSFGMTTIALTDGYYATSRLRNAKPDFLIHNLKEMISLGII